ncbi:MAG: hypothetical protein A2722_03330 [Candidatus Doudnabacteria bacterium RIFCSPHIGHO2_01_FULL_50_11]|uniref:YknX-like beta-barrel domain-containing protein n=1 Tax=Candidatus Doudnabacteria bacterium RIFCSPHIGHO2_01_FULL_50_11 TaxID=1817828 RepID=A0A1F5PI31_9BACT|nr:MAG: hypothetical protein A2722_03330 [Candidatus Doudnabacteria bacterium RIFCSPHIGHO2_01_FULL_50_11]HLC44806.1 efflux RND transporter periplasmic adaptor subunit [Patescibacteria group bacterium]
MKRFFTKKRIIWGVVAIVVIAIVILISRSGKSPADSILTEKAEKRDLVQSVLATGQVTSAIDLSLSFKTSGIVTRVAVITGKKVRLGEILATLDQRDQLASLTQARGAQASAQANYDKTLAGASSQEIDVARAAVSAAQATLDNANATYKATTDQQRVAVSNAYAAMLNAGLTAQPVHIYDSTVTLTISGTYADTRTGEYDITLSPTGGGGHYYHVGGLETDSQFVVRGIPLPLGKQGLYITFGESGTLSEVNVWKISIPNTQSSSYVTYQNAYQAALQTQSQSLVTAQNTINSAQVALDQAKASLALKQAAARPEDLSAAQAQLLSAQGQLQAAQANLENTIIRSPADGTITSVDLKVGELATGLKEVFILQDVGNLHVEANISEANIAAIKPGQTVDITFDAFGPDRAFVGSVQFVDPASTVVSGVVNYKVTTQIDQSEEVKPGMTANMTILTANAQGALSISQRAVLSSDGKKTVRIITDPKTKAYREGEVTLGLFADGGYVQVLSGLSEGEEIVSYINK